ncbi:MULTISPECIES: peptidase M14 [unclassified Acidovorax]|uniref:peptidase M14 n=1 Tax=unclassified Acidovorax TaxID=2684926 RepID=UPI0028830BF7|nr:MULTISPECIES: peptidase M14 [unclassified Acidovorax]
MAQLPVLDEHVLLDATVPRTLHEWLARFSRPEWAGVYLEGWLFEDADSRRAAERQLAAAGVHARLHSAYKPLVHYFLESVDRPQIERAAVRFPRVSPGAERRFALEAYPLAALLPEGALQLEMGDACDQPAGLHYDVQFAFKDGSSQAHRVFAPNRPHADLIGQPQWSPAGWLRAGTAPGAADRLDTPVLTDYEQLFAHVMHTVQSHAWGAQEPYFERLSIRIDTPGMEHALPAADERFSTHEALHEDLYFSLLEFFQRHSGRPAGDRRLQPGQIVPDVRALPASSGAPRVRIALQPFDVCTQDAAAWPDADAPDEPLHALTQAPSPKRIHAVLDALVGPATQRSTASSLQSRTVQVLYQPGSDAPVLISAAQHANETSGLVGALRAAEALRRQPGAHFALIALENPDGYALHRELCAQHPHHMHHAARYSALGDDIEYRETAPLYERTAREQALALSGAGLHINLHGYPAHEWTRPLTGYVPRGFEHWMLPKGFFLILRHHAGRQQQARALLEAVTATLRDVPGLAEFNARQMALYEKHAGPIPFEALHGFAFTVTENPRDAPVTLITEFPDETVHGDAFRFAHTVQMHTTLAAVAAWQRIAVAAGEVAQPAGTPR